METFFEVCHATLCKDERVRPLLDNYVVTIRQCLACLASDEQDRQFFGLIADLHVVFVVGLTEILAEEIAGRRVEVFLAS